MTPSEATPLPDDDISLLDLLLVVVENLRLLIVAPLLAGLLALGGVSLMPATYESSAVLTADRLARADGNPNVSPNVAAAAQRMVALVESELVLRPVAQSLPAVKNAASAPANPVSALRDRVQATVGKKDNFVTVSATAGSGAEAQALLQALLASLFQQSKPKGQDLQRLQDQLNQDMALHASTESLEKLFASRLQREGAGTSTESDGRLYVALTFERAARLQRMAAAKAQLSGLGPDDLIQAPNLPERPIKPKTAMVAVIAALATGFAALLFVFLRHALRQAAADPVSAPKIKRLRQLLRQVLGGRAPHPHAGT